MRMGLAIAGLLCVLLAACEPRKPGDAPLPASAAQGPLLPRAALFADPERKDPKLSPDGAVVAYLARNGEAYDLIAAQVADLADTKRLAASVETYEWAPGGGAIVYWTGGVAHAVSPAGEGDKVLVAEQGAAFAGASAVRPDKIVLRLGDTLFEIDVKTGARKPVFSNRGGYNNLMLDADNKVRVGTRTLPNGDTEFWSLDGAVQNRATLARKEVPYFTPRGMAPDGQSFFLLAPIGRDKAALTRVDMATGAETIAAADDNTDITDIWLDDKGAPQAYASGALPDWKPVVDSVREELGLVRSKAQGAFRIVSRSADDKRWVLVDETPAQAPRAWLYDRSAKTMQKLFDFWPALDHRDFAKVSPVDIAARDKFVLHGLFTAPKQSNGGLVIIAADDPGRAPSAAFDPLRQMLADAGYGVLEVAVRGARGFGAEYAKAGDGAYVAVMQSDLVDAARWAGARKLANADRIAIMGERLGGASAVSVLTLNVQDFACAIALDAPLDLNDAPLANAGVRADDAMLKSLSPMFGADKIVNPLLLVRRDWRTARAEADEFVAALAANKRPIVYAQFSAETEGFANAADRLSFYALAASFLSKCLGGRADPIGADFRGSSLQIVSGGDYIPTLSSAMAPRDDDLGSPP